MKTKYFFSLDKIFIASISLILFFFSVNLTYAQSVQEGCIKPGPTDVDWEALRYYGYTDTDIIATYTKCVFVDAYGVLIDSEIARIGPGHGITLRVDPEFETKMKKDRFITSDLPLTPIYDLVVQVIPTWKKITTIGYFTINEEVIEQPTNLPSTLEYYNVFIKVGDEQILGPGTLKLTNKKDFDGHWIYEWKISGNDLKGIVDGEKMEKLISAIKNASQPGIPKVTVTVELPQKYHGQEPYVEMKPQFSLCAPIEGSGEKKIIPMRNNTSSLSISDFISKANDVMNNAFAKTDPWKTYFDKLSFYIDLEKHNVGAATPLADVNNISNCKGATPLMYLIIGGNDTSPAADWNGHVAQIPKYSLEPDYLELAMHEAGHAVGHLWDASSCEVHFERARSEGAITLESNCTKIKSNFRYNNIWYGGVKQDDVDDSHYTHIPVVWFIPTLKNLMMHPGDNTKYYDVISCGFMVAAIIDQPVGDFGWTNVDWAHAQKHWPAVDSSGPNSKGCYAMDTAKSDIPPLNLNTPTITKINE